MQSRTPINQKCIRMAASLAAVIKYASLCQIVAVHRSAAHTKGPNTTLFLSIDFVSLWRNPMLYAFTSFI